VIRYYNTNNPSKNLTQSEAQALSDAGITLGAIWENGFPTSVGYFTYTKGVADAKAAYQYAINTISQPGGSAIYFAVDYDASTSDISGAIAEYFNGIAAGFLQENPYPIYEIGVYGSGNTCQYLSENGKVSYTWLAQSTGWGGYDTFTGWSIKQGPEETLCGLDIDTDETTDDFGGFSLNLD
jgi:hypothetical protein